MPAVFIGTSGFSYPHWVGKFYPKNLKSQEFLKFYSRHFLTVEVNSSFYHLPREKTVINWRKQVPASFVFSFKLSRFLTHIKKLKVEEDSLRKFFSALRTLVGERKKTLVLIQTPPSLKKEEEKLENFLRFLPKDFLYAVEFRHPSWFEESVYQILRKNKTALVYSDNPHLWPRKEVETAPFFYLRFHGSRRLFASSYVKKELEFYADLIKKKQKKGLEVFAYFNNDAEGWAVENARDLKQLVEK